MLCKLEADNFKSLNGFELEIHPLTIVVGNNASGKSTLLQVMDLMFGSVREDFSGILARRGWKVADLRSKCKGRLLSKHLTLAAEFYLDVEGKYRHLRWEMILQYVINKNQLILQHEIVKDVDSDNIYLDCQESGITLYRREQESLRFPRLTGNLLC